MIPRRKGHVFTQNWATLSRDCQFVPSRTDSYEKGKSFRALTYTASLSEMERNMMRLYWDFRGGRAQGTAEHFKRHLDSFLESNEVAHISTGTEAYSALHSAAFCDLMGEARPFVVERLRPHRQREIADEGA